MSAESVKVAVRVRPFNQREKERNAKLIISMFGKKTTIQNPQDPKNKKPFNFDYSYWSHDGFTVDSDGVCVPTDASSKYASQNRVFEDLGQDILDNAVKGYNCSLFAYGQTGSGKSYSMVGYEANRGVVPITCDELFKMIEESKMDKNKKFAVVFSMLEIYNERIRDLLSKTAPPSGGLKVRQTPKLGFYVQDVSKIAVKSYKDIEFWMNKGTTNRTVAATQMNATSSRAHTVITIEFKQAITHGSSVNTKTSTINLIDLAGSERAASTGATGDRLKEGASINKSLSALGNVIAALAEESSGKKKVLVPYRDSVLTKLLKNALGGNSKTVMIAALSPADINYDETLSTLRYADRAKSIKNVAVVNENPLEKIIRELREENERLKKLLKGEIPAGIDTKGMSEEEIEKMKAELEAEIRAELENNSNMVDLWEKPSLENEVIVEEDVPTHDGPHFVNVNQDPMLSGFLIHDIVPNDTGKVTLGREGDLKIQGPGIQPQHATITIEEGETWLCPAEMNATGNDVVRVNGSVVTGKIQLNDGDRVLLGSSNLYIFHNPLSPKEDGQKVWDWESAMKEIVEADGLASVDDSEDMSSLETEVLELLPMVHYMNAMAADLGKLKKFNIIIIPTNAQDVPYGSEASPLVLIKMTNLVNGNSWVWNRDKFVNRKFLVQDMYERFVEGEDISQITAEQDPFWEPEEDILVGQSLAILTYLAYNMSMTTNMIVIDYKGREEGTLTVRIGPCSLDGTPIEETDNPTELLGKPFNFKIEILKLKLMKPRFIHGSNVRFAVYKKETYFQTPTVSQTLEPEFNHSTVISFEKVTKDHLNYLMDETIMFWVYGIQKDSIAKDQQQETPGQKVNRDMQLQLSKAHAREMVVLSQNKRMEAKINRLKQLCIDWAAKNPEDQQFDSFYRAVTAATFSQGNKFKITAQLIGMSMAAKNKLANSTDDAEPDKVKPARITIVRKDNQPVDGSEACNVM